MSELSVFDFRNHSVRVVVNDPINPLFVAKDVASALGYKVPEQAIRDRCKGEVKHCPLTTKGGKQKIRVIAEPDLYRLIFGSKLKSAIQFQDWVFEQVLPAIRKTGEYKTPYKVNPNDNLSLEQADTLRDLLKDTAEKLPKAAKAKFMIQGWSKLKSHFGVSYRDIPQGEYVEAVSIVSRHVSEALQGEYLPKQNKQNNQMFHGLKDGRYLLYIEDGHTHIRDIQDKSIVDARFTHTLRHNFKTLAKQLWLLSGEQKESVIDLPMENLPHVN